MEGDLLMELRRGINKRHQRRRASAVPRNNSGEQFVGRCGRWLLPLPKGEGGGEGKEGSKIHRRCKNYVSFPLTLSPSPLGRGKRVIPPKKYFVRWGAM